MSPHRKYKRTDPRRYIVHVTLLGRRGGALLLGGIAWVLLGVQILRHHQPVPGSWLMSHGWQLQAAGWISTGLVACWYAFYRQGRDAPGWWAGLYPGAAWVVAVILESAARAMFTGDWWALFDTLDNGGINFCIVGWVAIMAGWREPVTIADMFKDGAP